MLRPRHAATFPKTMDYQLPCANQQTGCSNQNGVSGSYPTPSATVTNLDGLLFEMPRAHTRQKPKNALGPRYLLEISQLIFHFRPSNLAHIQTTETQVCGPIFGTHTHSQEEEPPFAPGTWISLIDAPRRVRLDLTGGNRR